MAEELVMGDLVPLRLTRKKILQEAPREINRMCQLSHGGDDPIPGEASRELFDLGAVDEVKWQDWRTYCLTVLNSLPDDPADP
ncbi:MAG: hypothetical protein WAK96_03205 [Desulfobaccales bacterium]